MTRLQDVLLTARRLSEQLGPDGAAIVAARAASQREEGDAEAARFWAQVAQAMAGLAERRRRTPD